MTVEALVQGLLTTSGGALVALIGVWFTRRKTNAEAAKSDADAIEVLTRASAALVGPLEQQITRLSEEVRKARAEVVHAKAEAAELVADLEHAQKLLRQHGVPWVPRRVV